ncbi:MAG: TRAP transporter large permease subunit [Candidatus Latescibacteria bacterium]|nr:TRAP transporter large permease subunit [Candidatus Latescibacterota bacterium]NIM64508.1 TRAP transporter large permease subunit [Candidatus Latescibacterota bacterium]NIO00661.1 TRAP transporter large permease subunit [Candidatus Latescibacterota bacterium]NIO27064.1 TRAP transporter large permease subunit [Candidatus Latescibacterota bacterium]NIO54588.1 TRAP transporter large permease subunit [Candidatus Latescibacterota bacterium]
MIVLFIIVLILLALFGMPLFSVLGSIALIAFNRADIDISSVAVSMYTLAGSPLLIAVPLFTFAGYLFAESGAPSRLVRVSRAFFPGGLAVVALVSCAVFTAFTGASGVTIIAMGGLLFPSLLQEGYSKRFSLGLVTASGSLGLLFPPSLPLILYGYVAAVSVDKLFLAGLLPGILLVIVLSTYGLYKGKTEGIQREPFSMRRILSASREAAWELPLPFIVLGGIYSGIITVMEAAALTALYALVAEVLIYRDIKPRELPRIIAESMTLVGGILLILACAMGLTNYLIDAEVPMRILEWMKTYITSKYTFLLLLNIFLLIVGCLMDIFSALIVVVPLIVPVALGFGVDPVHLGIIFLTNLEIGYLTPPVGLNLFISSYRFDQSVVSLYVASLPFLLLLLLSLIVITYLPAISLFLVRLVGG